MTNKNKTPFISAIVLTFNEEQNIRSCLNSLKDLAADIYIVDSYSTDKTLEIAKQYTDKIYQHPFKNQAEQFNWALDNLPLNTEWIMRLDADERVTEGLREELISKLNTLSNEIMGIYVKRRVYFMGRWIKHGGYYPTWLMRVFRKGKAICEQKNMDEHITLTEGTSVYFNNDIIDDNQKGLSFWIDKHNNFASREMAEIIDSRGNNRTQIIKPSLKGDAVQKKRWYKENLYLTLPLFIRSFFYFMYRYVIKLGFLDGKEGLIFHFLQGFWYRFLVDAKIFEFQKRRK